MPDEQQPPPPSEWQPPSGPPPGPTPRGSYLQQGYAAPAPYPQPGGPPAAVPVRAPRGLAVAVIVASVALAGSQVASWATSWSAADTLVQLARSGTDVLDAPLFLYDFVNLARVPALLAAYVLGCTWLYRARSNAERASPEWPHVRGRAWVWLAWWVPIVSFWFPYQVTRDVRAASVRDGSSGLLGLWWTGWLVFLWASQVSGRVQPVSGVPDADLARVLPWAETVATVGALVALVVWVRIVHEVTTAQGRWGRPD